MMGGLPCKFAARAPRLIKPPSAAFSMMNNEARDAFARRRAVNCSLYKEVTRYPPDSPPGSLSSRALALR
jgi:hypothetical protein